MKTKLIFLIALMVFAVKTSIAVDSESTMRTEIMKQIQYPKAASELKVEGIVFAEFKINTDGTIEVVNCTSTEGKLQTYVFTKLSALKVTYDAEFAGKTFMMRFDFKLENK